MQKSYKVNLNDIFVSTVTENLIKSCNDFSNKFNKRIIFISSLNQVSLYENSYLYNDISFLKNKISNFKNKKLFIGRDHFGKSSVKNLRIKNKNLFLVENLINDLENDLDFIHLDFADDNNYKKNIEKYMNIILSSKKNVTIEIGLNKDGEKSKFETLNELARLSNIYFKKDKIITFQTGAKLFNNSNNRKINYENIKKNSSLFKNFYFKEHNCDFKLKNHFKRLNKLNFLFNIGPEFAYYENKFFCKMIEKKLDKSDYQKLYDTVLDKKLWNKWCSKYNNNKEKIYSSLHYFQKNKIYKNLKEKLEKKISFNEIIINKNIKLMKSKFIF